MKFQEIDYHVLIFKAYLEPEEVRFEFLDLAREKSGYSENAFLAKLDQALKNLKSAFEYYLNDHKFRLRSNFTDLQLPISMLNRWPGLENFAVSFQGHLSEELLDKIDSFLLSYRFKLVDRLFERKIQELEKSELKQEPEPNLIENEHLIIIDAEIRPKLFEGLKQYFEGQEPILENLMNSTKINEKLVWRLNQNQLAELFSRLAYNGFIKNNKTQIKSWLAENFTLLNGQINESSVYDILKRKSEVKKDKRILEDLAPFKPKTK